MAAHTLYNRTGNMMDWQSAYKLCEKLYALPSTDSAAEFEELSLSMKQYNLSTAWLGIKKVQLPNPRLVDFTDTCKYLNY